MCLYVARACFSMCCMTISVTTKETGEPIAVPCGEVPCIESKLTLGTCSKSVKPSVGRGG